MRVALIDNMNNSFFSLCRYLRDEGVDAHLYRMPQENPIFRPEADTFADVERLGFVHVFPVDAKGFRFLASRRQRLAAIRSHDLIISCGYGLGFLARHGIRSDVFIPYGSDLYYMPFSHLWPPRNPLTVLGESLLAFYQRKGMRAARVIVVNDRHPLYGRPLRRLGLTCLNVGCPAVYNREPPLKAHPMWRFMDQHDFVVINHSRQLWCTKEPGLHDFALYGGIKRNDKLFRAYAAFVRRTAFAAPVLVAFEYGSDVAASKKLIRELGIEPYVRWMPVSPRKDIVSGIRRASLVAGQFREGFCGVGGTSMEALASGIPLVTHTNGAEQDPRTCFFGAPIINALSEDDILKVLQDYEANREKYASIGQASREWFDENMGAGLARRYTKMLDVLHEDPSSGQTDARIMSIFKGEVSVLPDPASCRVGE